MVSIPFALNSVVIVTLVASLAFLVGREMSDSRGAGAPGREMSDSRGAGAPVPHFYFLLDRSGSMAHIAHGVVDGFNAFVEAQRSVPGQMRMTLLQFDSMNPHEVVFEARDIETVPLLTPEQFSPRSATPLFDAMGDTIAMAERQQTESERIVVVTFSDGRENASRRHSQKSIFDRVASKRELGWTFVFLGANQDSYAEGGGMGFVDKNTQNFAFDDAGTHAAFKSMSAAMESMRNKVASGSYEHEDFFEGEKTAEDDWRARD